MKRLAVLSIIALTPAFTAPAERYNGVYIGEDVSSRNPKQIAVEFTEDGTVVVYMGATVPGLKDQHGQPVQIRRVRTIHQ